MRFLGQLGRRKRCAMDAVAAGTPSQDYDAISLAGCCGVGHLRQQPHRAAADQRLAQVPIVV